MASSGSRGLVLGDPLSPHTRKLASVLARARSGEVLALLYERPYRSASDVARGLGIHVATAQKYLQELRECGLVHARARKGVSRHTEEYWVASPRISIDIDFDRLMERPDAERRARSVLVREAAGGRAVYESDPRAERVTEVLLLEDGARRRIAARLALSPAEGRFLYHLPTAQQEHRTVLDIARRAGLPDAALPELLDLVERASSGSFALLDRKNAQQVAP